MRITADIEIENRIFGSGGVPVYPRPVRAQLSVGRKHQAGTDDACNVFLMIFTQQNRAGEKYKLFGNVVRITDNLALDGKCTIVFVDPSQDIIVSGISERQLHSFLGLVRAGISGNVNSSTLKRIQRLDNVSTSAPESIKTLVINDVSSYPITTGFPSSLETLEISVCGLALKTIDTRVFKLTNLTSLTLSFHCASRVPEDWSLLSRLVDLNLSSNMLDRLPVSMFKFLTRLVNLDLSDNQLRKIPHYITRLENLKTLNLSQNDLGRLPLRIGNLRNLNRLEVAGNFLRSLPYSLLFLPLIGSLDVKDNRFFNQEDWDDPEYRLTANVARAGVLHYEEAGARLKNDENYSYPNVNRICAGVNYLWWKDNNSRDSILEFIDKRRRDMKSLQYKALKALWDGTGTLNVLVTENRLKALSSLAELAAKTVLLHRVPYSPENIGSVLCDYLDLSKPCGVYRCPNHIFQSYAVGRIFWKACHFRNIITNPGIDFLPFEILFCSRECMYKYLTDSHNTP